jgi:Mg2+-importing ATPase
MGEMMAKIILPEQYWSQPLESLLATLGSTPAGLETMDAQQRQETFGPNLLAVKERVTALGLFLNQFKSPIVLILLFATGVSAIAQEWVDAGIILAIALGSAALSFIQEYSASSAVENLRAQVTIKANVLRDGASQSIPAEEIVPGDIVLLSAGSLVPSDAVLLVAR